MLVGMYFIKFHCTTRRIFETTTLDKIYFGHPSRHLPDIFKVNNKTPERRQ